MRREWRLLSEPERDETSSLLWASAFAPGTERSVMRRLALGVAAVAVCGGAAGAAALMSSLVPLIMAMRPHDVMVALEIVRLLPEEAEATDAGARGGAGTLCRELAEGLGPELLRFLALLLAGEGSPLAVAALSEGTTGGVVAVLGCLESWARVGVGLAAVAASDAGGALYSALLAGLAAPSANVVGAAADALCELVRVAAPYPPPAALAGAVEALARAIASAAAAPHDAPTTRRLAGLAAALVEQHAAYAVSGGAAATALLEVLLAYAGDARDRELLIVTVDAWLTIQTVPVAERSPGSAAPLFERLLRVVVAQVAYPPGAAGAVVDSGSRSREGGDEGVGDDDDGGLCALRARDGGVQELLESTLGLLTACGVDYLGALLGRVSAPGAPWQELEAALFAAAAVGGDLSRLLTRPAESAAGTAVQGRLSGAAAGLLGLVTRMPPRSLPPALVATACGLVGALAPWLPRAAASMPGLLEGALAFAFGALRRGDGAGSAAAGAIASIADHAAAGLATEAALRYMMGELEDAGAAGLDAGDREGVLDAICVVVGALPTPGARAGAAAALLSPYAARLEGLAAGGAGGGDALVVSEASLLCAALTQLAPRGGGSGEAHPAADMLPGLVRPLASLAEAAAARGGGAAGAAADAALRCLRGVLTVGAADPRVAALAAPAAEAALRVFGARGRAAAFEALEGAAAALGGGAGESLAALVARAVDAALEWAGSAPDALVRGPDVVRAVFDFGAAIAADALHALLHAAALPRLLPLAAAALTLAHHDAVASACRFAQALLDERGLDAAGPDARRGVMAAVGGCGSGLVDAALLALTGGGTTRATTGLLGQLLYVLVRAGGDDALSCVARALRGHCDAARVAAVAEGWRPDEGCVPSGLAGLTPDGQAEVVRMLRHAAGRRALARFRSCVVDIAKVRVVRTWSDVF